MSEVQWRHINCVIEILVDSHTPAEILTWLTAEHDRLDGQRPVDLIAEKAVDDVLTEARRIAKQ